MRLAFGFVFGGYPDNMQPLNVIKDYYGEKLGFFFAWLMHYTGWLLLGSVIGIIFTIIAIVIWTQNEHEQPLESILDSPVCFLYALFIMIWLTMFNESWKRK